MNSPKAMDHTQRMTQMLTPVSANTGDASSVAAGSPSFLDPLSEDPLARVLNARNPLLEAAQPLLRTLAELPFLQTMDDVPHLRDLLVKDIAQFQNVCERAHFRRDHVVTVRYCLCTALDEAINQRPWARDGMWSANSLLIQFHNESSGGEKFFLLLGRMAQQPQEHIQVLELLYHILSLGFQGRYSLFPDGLRQLETIHSRLLSILLEHRPSVIPELSIHWQGSTGGTFRMMHSLPVWVSASVLGVVVLAVFFMLQQELSPQAATLTTRIHSLTADPAPSPYAPVELPLERWFSVKEQERYNLRVDAQKNVLTLPGAAFRGGDTLHESMNAVLDTVAQHLRSSERNVDIIGHTDNVALRTGSVFKDNQHLSEARAQAVANGLKMRGIAPDRLHITGKGESVPIASNASESGRVQNRRVEMVLHAPAATRTSTRGEKP